MILTIFDGNRQPRTFCLDEAVKRIITFGRGPDNDIVLYSVLVSHKHGRFVFRNGHWIIEDRAVYNASGSTNGFFYADNRILSREIGDDDFIRIGQASGKNTESVLFAFSSSKQNNKWDTLLTSGKRQILIGRNENCDIVLPHISTSRLHAKIVREQNGYYIIDNNSTNGVIVNNRRISDRQQLHEKDIIVIGNSKLVFTSAALFYYCHKKGISVDVNDVVIIRNRGRKAVVTGNHVSLHVKPGELIAIIGGSGAGKSTILNCMCGYLPPKEGNICINGVDLYRNFYSLKNLVGYVPQSDIVYDNLTLYDMLSYTAKLRLPKDTVQEERIAAIESAIHLVELDEKKNNLIKSLSGGQRKRASIAVELLSDPNLLFLDEPASGLDPGTERNLMCSLREMADSGKTVILVTHSTLQLRLCDKIAFMGKGGNLCFFGSYEDALKFFGVSDVVDIYNMITENAEVWRERYNKRAASAGVFRNAAGKKKTGKKKRGLQLPVLCSRYMKLVINDRQRLLLLLAQAPVLALLISLVADGQQFEQYEMTKSLLFAVSCSAFWVGMLNAIQEVCKERTIIKREYMTGLSLTSYIISKILVLGVLCLIQSAFIIGVFSAAIGLPTEGLFMASWLELFVTTFLTAAAAAAMGLFVSSLFTNADRAMTIAPILLMPQILFSGLIFKLDGATEMISWLALCRWSMEGYGTTANLNELQLKLQQQGIAIAHEAERFFEFTSEHMFTVWGILVLFTIIFLAMARMVLSGIGKD